MSSPSSFHTAEAASPHSTSTPRLTISSGEARAGVNEYRDVRNLPYELREHCRIYFEEELYLQALLFLHQLLVSGTQSSKPAFVPPPSHLALAVTFTVHPTLTSRASSVERTQASIAALKLLRAVNKLVGPVNAGFESAFVFTSSSVGRRGGLRRRADGEHSPDRAHEWDSEAISSPLATTNSLWSQAEDFWQVVGWAFNCSVVWPKRWEHWKLWLEFMLDVLEDDWAWRDRVNGDDLPLEEALIVKYLAMDFNRNAVRRVTRAIFADGSEQAMKEFPEVWKNETREKREKKAEGDLNRIRPPQSNLNIDEDQLGDYAEDDDDFTPPASPRSPNSSTLASSPPPPASTTNDPSSSPLGDLPALLLRQRLMSLLSRVAATLKRTAFTDLHPLYTLYGDSLLALPLSTFALFASPTFLPYFEPEAHNSLYQLMLRARLSPDAPLPPPNDGDTLTLETLMRCFLPFGAASGGAEENARVGLLIEGLFRLLLRHGDGANWEVERLQEAVETGIEERERRAREGRKRKRGRPSAEDKEKEKVAGVDGPEMEYLKGSAARLRMLVRVIMARKSGAMDES